MRLDPETGDVVGEPTEISTETADIAIGDDAAWVADFDDSRVVELQLEAAP